LSELGNYSKVIVKIQRFKGDIVDKISDKTQQAYARIVARQERTRDEQNCSVPE
jgi:hypothetical protein